MCFLSLDVVNVDFLATGASLVATIRVTVLVELEGAIAVLLAAEGVGFVDLGCLGELAVGFEGTGFVCCVLETICAGKKRERIRVSTFYVLQCKGKMDIVIQNDRSRKAGEARNGCWVERKRSHHIAFVILVITQRQQDDVALVDPDLLAKFATNVSESACAIKALSLKATVSIVRGKKLSS